MAVGQVYYNVLDKSASGTKVVSSGIDIFNDIIPAIKDAEHFSKVGIQATPGTIVNMKTDNGDWIEIMIGISGIYELDENIKIIGLKFNRPPKYEYDESASIENQKNGAQIMNQAHNDRDKAIEQLLNNYGVNNAQGGREAPTDPSSSTFRAYWDGFVDIQTTFLEKYNEGLAAYQSGINGIYTLPNKSNLEDPENYGDLYNVIIDFIY